MLTGYSSTPHPATGVAPYEALMNRKVRSSYAIKRGRVTRMLVIQPLLRGMTAQTGCWTQKHQGTQLHCTRSCTVEANKGNQWLAAHEPATKFEPTYQAQRITDEREVYRESDQFKIANALIRDNAYEERADWAEELTSEDWREKNPVECRPSVSPRGGYHPN